MRSFIILSFAVLISNISVLHAQKLLNSSLDIERPQINIHNQSIDDYEPCVNFDIHHPRHFLKVFEQNDEGDYSTILDSRPDTLDNVKGELKRNDNNKFCNGFIVRKIFDHSYYNIDIDSKVIISFDREYVLNSSIAGFDAEIKIQGLINGETPFEIPGYYVIGKKESASIARIENALNLITPLEELNSIINSDKFTDNIFYRNRNYYNTVREQLQFELKSTTQEPLNKDDYIRQINTIKTAVNNSFSYLKESDNFITFLSNTNFNYSNFTKEEIKEFFTLITQNIESILSELDKNNPSQVFINNYIENIIFYSNELYNSIDNIFKVNEELHTLSQTDSTDFILNFSRNQSNLQRIENVLSRELEIIISRTRNFIESTATNQNSYYKSEINDQISSIYSESIKLNIILNEIIDVSNREVLEIVSTVIPSKRKNPKLVIAISQQLLKFLIDIKSIYENDTNKEITSEEALIRLDLINNFFNSLQYLSQLELVGASVYTKSDRTKIENKLKLHLVNEYLKSTEISLNNIGAKPGDELTIIITNGDSTAVNSRELEIILRLHDYGLDRNISENLLFLKRVGVKEPEINDNSTSDTAFTNPLAYNFQPTASISLNWTYYPEPFRCDEISSYKLYNKSTKKPSKTCRNGRAWRSFLGFLEPGFGINVSFPQFGSRITQTTPITVNNDSTQVTSYSVNVSNVKDNIHIGVGIGITLFDNAINIIPVGWNLSVDNKRRYWAIGFSFVNLGQKISEVIR